MKIIGAAKALIVVGKEVLILRNSKTHPRWPLMGDLPGGTVEFGESIEQALRREVLEETGISLTKVGLKEVFASTDIRPSVTIIHHLFVCYINEKPTLVLDYEHDEYEWVDLKDVSNIEPSYQEAVDTVISNYII